MTRTALAKNNFYSGSFVAEVVAHGSALTADGNLSAKSKDTTMQGLSVDEKIRWLIFGFTLGMGLLVFVHLAQAQHNHAAGHDEYRNWVSRDNASCCNNSDCGQIKPEDERWQDGKLEIKVENKWCPVTPGMYLRTGKSPDWQASHACVWPNWSGDQDVCSRLKCYQGRGGV